MIQAGYPPKMLQEIMGHASIIATLDLYGQLYPGAMDRYADRLDSAADRTGKTKSGHMARTKMGTVRVKPMAWARSEGLEPQAF